MTNSGIPDALSNFGAWNSLVKDKSRAEVYKNKHERENADWYYQELPVPLQLHGRKKDWAQKRKTQSHKFVVCFQVLSRTRSRTSFSCLSSLPLTHAQNPTNPHVGPQITGNLILNYQIGDVVRHSWVNPSLHIKVH